MSALETGTADPENPREPQLGVARASIPAEILAYSRAVYPQRRTPNAHSLQNQKSAGFLESLRAFKGISCDDISEFESHMPSHAVASLWRPLGSYAFFAMSLKASARLGESLTLRIPWSVKLKSKM